MTLAQKRDVIARWAAGETSTAIAAALGVTRNAVIGHVWRTAQGDAGRSGKPQAGAAAKGSSMKPRHPNNDTLARRAALLRLADGMRSYGDLAALLGVTVDVVHEDARKLRRHGVVLSVRKQSGRRHRPEVQSLPQVERTASPKNLLPWRECHLGDSIPHISDLEIAQARRRGATGPEAVMLAAMIVQGVAP